MIIRAKTYLPLFLAFGPVVLHGWPDSAAVLQRLIQTISSLLTCQVIWIITNEYISLFSCQKAQVAIFWCCAVLLQIKNWKKCGLRMSMLAVQRIHCKHFRPFWLYLLWHLAMLSTTLPLCIYVPNKTGLFHLLYFNMSFILNQTKCRNKLFWVENKQCLSAKLAN